MPGAWPDRDPRQQLRTPAQGHVIGVHLDMHPGAGVATVVHRVIEQPCMATHGDTLACRAQVGFGGHGVLVVAEIVGGVGEHLNHGDAQIGRAALLPGGHHHGQTVEHQTTEAGVVFGQVVDQRLWRQLRRAHDVDLAIEFAGTVHLEGKLHLDRIGSKPSGGRVSVDEVTSCSVYGEKSPAVSVRTTSTWSDSGKARKKSFSAAVIWPWVTNACEASEALASIPRGYP